MNKMVNKLQLKRVIIRRFTNEDSDDDEGEDRQSCSSDIQVIEKTDHNISDTNSINSNQSEVSNNDKYTNYKITVRKFGQNVERFVDINGNGNPFAVNDTLDQFLASHELEEQLMPSNVTLISHEDKCEVQNDLTSDSKEFEIKAKELKLEGIRHKPKTVMTFKCHVCDIKVIGLQLALDHSISDFHLKKKFGDDLQGLDALFTIDSETIGDVKTAISRRRELKKISSENKRRYFNHGIRLKNGFGENSYICSECNLSLSSLKEVEKHFENSDKQMKTLVAPNKVDQKLYNEGIKSTESTDGSKYLCTLCNIYFDFKRIAVSHISDTRHKKQKSGENLNKVDSQFTIPSKRIDELEVAFARKTVLKTITPTKKIEFTHNFIRLEDGIGKNSFICLKCDIHIESVQQIEEHVRNH